MSADAAVGYPSGSKEGGDGKKGKGKGRRKGGKGKAKGKKDDVEAISSAVEAVSINDTASKDTGVKNEKKKANGGSKENSKPKEGNASMNASSSKSKSKESSTKSVKEDTDDAQGDESMKKEGKGKGRSRNRNRNKNNKSNEDDIVENDPSSPSTSPPVPSSPPRNASSKHKPAPKKVATPARSSPNDKSNPSSPLLIPAASPGAKSARSKSPLSPCSPRKVIKPFTEDEMELLACMYTEEEFTRHGDAFEVTVRPQVGGFDKEDEIFVEAGLRGDVTRGIIYIAKVAGISANQNAELAKLLATTVDEDGIELALFDRVQKFIDRVTEMNGELDMECPICLLDFEDDDQDIVRLQGCFHAHHKACLSQWWFGKPSAPAWRPEAEDLAKSKYKQAKEMLCAVCRAPSTRIDRLAVMPDWAAQYKDEFLPAEDEEVKKKGSAKELDSSDSCTIMIRTELGVAFTEFFDNIENEFDGVKQKFSYKPIAKRNFYMVLITFTSSKLALDALLELNNRSFGDDGDFFHCSFHVA
jgi:hypothetical protein